MKKIIILLAIVTVVLSMGSFAFAASKEEPKFGGEHSAMPMSPDMERGGAMGMGSRVPMMSSMVMMQMLREKSITPTSDGGVLIIVGNQMIKYDKDLNVVKEAELKIDTAKLRESAMEMMPYQNLGRESMMPRTKAEKLSESKQEKS